MPIIVEIGSKSMPIDAVLALAPGSIIELSKGVEEELEIKVGNTSFGSGVVVKIGENFGVRISFVGDIKKRIEALADESDNVTDDDEAEALAAQLLAGQF